ncbi:unnamed protein product [Fusarium graminearum]|uniref:Uncharacterized protein n=1 Tax=Gibberella zeae TaxID=5518 RepID=A0A4E9EM39_GIBZA|nr:unnamed protein product [Fusarium graminearum]
MLARKVLAVFEYFVTVVHYTVVLAGLGRVLRGTGNMPTITKGLSPSKKITIVLDCSIFGFPSVLFGGIELESEANVDLRPLRLDPTGL